jgi:hypothetical protein
MKALRASLCLGAVAALFASTIACAQIPTYKEAGPVPPALAAAKTIFVSNAGSDSGLFPAFSGDENRAYTGFSAALLKTRAYALVGDPSQADLVVELQLTTAHSLGDATKNYPGLQPQFRLVVYDRKTHYILWTFTQLIDMAILQRNLDRNFDDALALLLNQFLQVAGKTPAPAPDPTH